MAANSPIGNVTDMYIKSSTTSREENKRKIWGELNPEATYQQVNTFARALYGLSSDTYDDTILITEQSVNEQVEE